jgi:hypothetical protein
MKTQITAETNDSVRTLIALRLRGELRLASRVEVREYMEQVIADHVRSLEFRITTVANLLDPPSTASHQRLEDDQGRTGGVIPVSDTEEVENDG